MTGGVLPNRFTYIASLLFILNSLILVYYNYSQIFFVASAAVNVGFANFVNSLTFDYSVQILTSVFIVLGAVSSVLIISSNRKIYYVASSTLLFMLIFFSYEYLTTVSTSTSGYLLYVNIIIVLNMLLLVLSRTSSVAIAEENRIYSKPLSTLPKIGAYG